LHETSDMIQEKHPDLFIKRDGNLFEEGLY